MGDYYGGMIVALIIIGFGFALVLTMLSIGRCCAAGGIAGATNGIERPSRAGISSERERDPCRHDSF